MGGGKGNMPDVPEPEAPPKQDKDVAGAFRTARAKLLQKPQRGLSGTDLTQGLLAQLPINLGKKTLLGQ